MFDSNFSVQVVKCVLIASPGFLKDHLYDYLINYSATQQDLKQLGDNRAKFVLAHSSSGFMDSLRGKLDNNSPAVSYCALSIGTKQRPPSKEKVS